ncbi:MAG: hypothetical protein KGL39_15185 [Patescibacteria group bacterium]|nr:hypothetical protein [Patescibacteria group bacterium]
MFYMGPQYLAPAGSTGNNTHGSVQVQAAAQLVIVKFDVEAVGGTPTVTWKVQGAVEQPEVSDANSNWFDMIYLTDATDTSAVAARTATAVGAQVQWLDVASGARWYPKIRLVTSANTNVTYHAELFVAVHNN